jgi:membrane fusion protein (multidrug efflux system)
LPPDNATGNFVKIAQRIPVRIRLDKQRQNIDLLSAGMSAGVKVKKND